ncbi:MAG: hypothetical protein JNM72_25310 [Deltaproteobacteria bacterium]|nr:hypothetical protein [Deltaproteobacteria bacterium]
MRPPLHPRPAALRLPWLVLLSLALALVGPAEAAPRLRASAAEIPALARLLAATGWTPTPELSAVFQPGHIFLPTPTGHRLQLEGCVAAAPQRSAYTGAQLVSQLQAGVQLPGARGQGGFVQELRFAAPEQRSLPALALEATPRCAAALARAAAEGAPLDGAYIVQEVLFAEITERRCGKLDARGRVVGVGLAGLEAEAACGQVSLEPVAVAYRTLPLSALRGVAVATVAVADRDGDGVPNADDSCPDEAGAPGAGGCPADRDGDGLADQLDPCPDDHGGPSGCPSTLGASGAVGALPDCADVYGGPPPADCGSQERVFALALSFRPGQAALPAAGPAEAALLAEALRGQWGAALRIEAWGDGVDPITDLSLAQARADALRAAVIAAGADPARVVARGYPGAPPPGGAITAVLR